MMNNVVKVLGTVLSIFTSTLSELCLTRASTDARSLAVVGDVDRIHACTAQLSSLIRLSVSAWSTVAAVGTLQDDDDAQDSQVEKEIKKNFVLSSS